MARVLYLTYDGILEPLGESQVAALLERLALRHQIWLVSYEKRSDWANGARVASMRARMERAGIAWVVLRYHQRPTVPATSYDAVLGFFRCAWIVTRRRIDIIHARSYVPGLLALGVKRFVGTRFIFDMRGFWPNEKVMAGEWRKDTVLHKLAKWCERRLLLGADIVVSLTHAGVDHMRRMPFLQGRATWFEVIPTCVDTKLFQAGPGTRRPFTLGYVGSVGGRYRFDAVLDCFKFLRTLQLQARLRIISLGARAAILKELWLHGVPEQSVELTREDRAGVARELGAVDAAILFYRTGLSSTLGTAPTRLGEFLAAGVPCLTNAGVGDASGLLEREGIGVILQDVDNVEQRQQAVRELMRLAAQPGIRQRCAEVAERVFSLERAVEAYDGLYRSLAAHGAPPPAADSREPLEVIHAGR